MAESAGRRNILRELTPVSEAAPDPVFFRTPTKSPKKNTICQRLSVPTRSSPRKKLCLTPDKQNEAIEKKRLSLQNMDHSINTEANLKALSHAQLIQLISDASNHSPGIRETLFAVAPTPDLTPVEERLNVLQRNILKAIPRNVWGNEDGSFCFLRVRAHLDAFKKECLDYGRQFVESQHWPSVFEYILIAWKITAVLPDWPSLSQNKIKSSCVKYLAAQCISALKKTEIDETSLHEIIQRLEEINDHPEVRHCVTFAKDLLKSE